MIKLIQLALGMLPASPLKNRLLSLTSRSWSIAPTASIAPNFFFGCEIVEIARDARIGPFNIFRGLHRLSIAEEGEINALNWVSGAGGFMPTTDESLRGSLVVKRAGTIVSRHFLDCSGGISIGEYAGIAGYKVTVMSHSVNVAEGGQQSAPVILGDRSMIAVGSLVLAGVTIAERCVVAAGSVVVKSLTEPDTLYGGSPAKPIGSTKGAKLLNRDQARVTTEEDHERMKAEVARARAQQQ